MHKLHLLSLFSLLMGAVTLPEYGKIKLSVSSDVIGPYEIYQKDVQINFTYSLGAYREVVHEELRLYDVKTGAQVFKSSKADHAIDIKQNLNVTFTLPLSRYFGPNGLKMRFFIYEATKSIFDKSVTIYPKVPTDVVVNEGGGRYQSNTLAFSLSTTKIIEYGDDFNFTGFKDYIDADSYYDLNLNGVSFLYNSSKLPYYSAELILPDPKHNFKFLYHSYGNINLPLYVVDDGEIKKLKFFNSFYVDRLNLDLSQSKRNGFVKTDRFFFPVNKKKDFLGTDIEITIYDCGFNGNNYIFKITYDIFRELIGSCNESDYCIRGEID